MAQILNGLAFGSLLLILSSGLVLIFGLRDVINFAHGGLYMLGAYIGLSVVSAWNFWIALLVVPAVLAAVGAVVDHWGLRHLEHRVHIVPVLALFGLTLILDDLVVMGWGRGTHTVSAPELLAGATQIMGVSYPVYRIFVICVGAGIAASLLAWLRRSSIGLHVRAASHDDEAAAMMGVNVEKASTIIIALGFALAGLAGVLTGPYSAINPGMGANILILTFIVVVVGGLGSVAGAMIAAMFIGLVLVAGSVYAPAASSFAPYVLMAVVLIVKPTGFAGSRV